MTNRKLDFVKAGCALLQKFPEYVRIIDDTHSPSAAKAKVLDTVDHTVIKAIHWGGVLKRDFSDEWRRWKLYYYSGSDCYEQ